MKIVIDIPEDVYKRTVFYREFRDLNDCVTTIKALEKATPLPKHHGRLIDADKFHEVIENIPIKDTDKWFNWMQKTCNRLADAPTIIEGSDSE